MISASTPRGGSKPLSSLKKPNSSVVKDQSEKNAGTAGQVQTAKATHHKTVEKATPAPEHHNKNMIEVDSYLKMISKFEKLLGEGDIGEKELNNMFSAMEKKIEELDNLTKKRLLNLRFFQQRSIKNIKQLKQSLIEMFQDPLQQQDGLNFLKSDEFTSLLLQKPQAVGNYSNPGKKEATPPTAQRSAPAPKRNAATARETYQAPLSAMTSKSIKA